MAVDILNSNSFRFDRGSLVIENAISYNGVVYHLVVSQEGQDLSQRVQPAPLNEYVARVAQVWQEAIARNNCDFPELGSLVFMAGWNQRQPLLIAQYQQRKISISSDCSIFQKFFLLRNFFESTQV